MTWTRFSARTLAVAARKTRATYDPRTPAARGDPVFIPHGSAAQRRMIANLKC